MKKKVLIVASTASMIKQFNLRNIKILKSLGYEVHVAANFKNPGTITTQLSEKLAKQLVNTSVIVHNIDFSRGMGNFKRNVIASKQLLKVFKENKFEFVHTQAALASVLTRLIAPLFRVRVLYTIHGMQFSKESSLLRWIFFFPVEWVLSLLTYAVIVINEDDERIVKKFFLTKCFRVNGVGIDYSRFNTNSENKKQKSRRILITVGELSKRKNQKMVIQSLSNLKQYDWEYLVVGIGPMQDELNELAKSLNIADKINFIGYSEEIVELYRQADVAIFASYLEGLLTAGMEAMAAGLPSVYSNVRGIRDYLEDGRTGFKVRELTVKDMTETLKRMLETSDETLLKMGVCAKKEAQQFDKRYIDQDIVKIYELMGKGKA